MAAKMKLAGGKISVRDMRFHARHGVLEQERLTGGDFTVSVEAACRLDRAVASDNVDDTLNYADIYNIVREEMAIPSRLIEHVAGRIGERLLGSMPRIEELTVSVTKENPPMGADCRGAGVQLHWINDEKDN